MRIFVFTPVYRLEPETVAALFALEWDGPITWHLQRDNPYGDDGRKNILHQYQKGREAFLAGDYDAMLVVESDVIPPPDALKKLVALNVDVAYGVYVFRGDPPIINIFERYPQPARNTGESLTIHPGKLKKAVKAGKVACSGGGLGCTLIKRHALERFEFRMERTAHCDTYFTRDVYQAGLSMVAEMSVICGHKHEDGRIKYPGFYYAQ